MRDFSLLSNPHEIFLILFCFFYLKEVKRHATHGEREKENEKKGGNETKIK